MKDKKDSKEISLGKISGGLLIPDYIEEILEREILQLGNSGHCKIPKKHIGKKSRIIILKKEEASNKK